VDADRRHRDHLQQRQSQTSTAAATHLHITPLDKTHLAHVHSTAPLRRNVRRGPTTAIPFKRCVQKITIPDGEARLSNDVGRPSGDVIGTVSE